MPETTHHLVWFRRDLRVEHNPAWAAATQQGDEVTGLFVVDPRLFDRAGSFRQIALVAHLAALDRQLRERGGRLRVEGGDAASVLSRVVADTGASVVHWNADTTPFAVTRDADVEAALGEHDVTVTRHWGTLVHEPGRVLTHKGTLSKVFTPFFKAWDKTPMTEWAVGEGDASLSDVAGPPIPKVAGSDAFPGGEEAARERLGRFLDKVDDYLETRDIASIDGTSRISADLRFGTLSPREVATIVGESTAGRAGFVRQLAWRDWYAHLLFDNPSMPDAAIKSDYDRIKWRDDPDEFDAWRNGRTGYPIVDAGMRQLRQTGWMHNRVRMIVGSFLVKDLLVDWRKGERWFRHLLVDADVAQNVGNWQWVAGCGTDAAPYFRVFNPWTQSRKFDPGGNYIRRWVPELSQLDDKAIHEPSAAAPLELVAGGVVLGATYPYPIVDHASARNRALDTYKKALDRS